MLRRVLPTRKILVVWSGDASPLRRRTVTPDEREHMHILCERIAKEQDRKTFSKLVCQLNDLLDKKAQRLQARSTKPAASRLN